MSASPVFRKQTEISENMPDRLAEILDSDNIIEEISQGDLHQFASDLLEEIQNDKGTMSDYLRTYKKIDRYVQMKPEHEGVKSFPFDGASNVVLPYIADAALDFNSRASKALLSRKNICKTANIGKESDEKNATGKRVADAVNFQLNHGIKGWRDEQDQALLIVAAHGQYFKKTYKDPDSERYMSNLILPNKLIWNHKAESFDRAETKTEEYELTHSEVVGAQRSQQIQNLDIDLDTRDKKENIQFYECHCLLDIDDDGVKEPYIVHIEKERGRIVAIEPRFTDESVFVNEENEVVRIEEESFYTQTIFIPDPTGKPTGMGWGALMSPLFECINTNQNQIIDAGTLQNVGGSSGFISNKMGKIGSRIRKGSFNLTMGQMTYVESSGQGALKDQIVTFPFAGPSVVLADILEKLKAEMISVTKAAGIDAQPNEAAEMYLARLEQAMVTPSAIMTRVFSGITKEIKRLHYLMGEYMTDEEYSEILDEEASVDRDFNVKKMDVIPTSDPSQGSQSEQMARNKVVLDMAMAMPQLFEPKAVMINYLQSIGIEEPERLLAQPKEEGPDPFQEMQAQAVQQMSQAEMLKGQASMMGSQAKLMEAQARVSKTSSEVDKLRSEAMKNLSEVDKNESDTSLKQLDQMHKQSVDQAKEMFEVAKINQQKNQG